MKIEKISLSLNDVCFVIEEALADRCWSFKRVRDYEYTKEEAKKISRRVTLTESETLTADLFSAPNVSIIVEDLRKENGKSTKVLTLDNFNNAMVKLAKKYPEIIADFLTDEIDEWGAGIIMQYAVYGREIYR